MPITKSAKKSLKVSLTKKAQNDLTKIKLSKALKATDAKNVSKTISAIDKAAKHGLIHPNKAARMKSRLTKKFGTSKQENQKSEIKNLPDNAKSWQAGQNLPDSKAGEKVKVKKTNKKTVSKSIKK